MQLMVVHYHSEQAITSAKSQAVKIHIAININPRLEILDILILLITVNSGKK